MYPKVKVKELEEDDLLTINTRPPLEDSDFLLTYDFNSPASEYEDDSPTSVVRIPDSYVSSLAHLAQGEANCRNKKKSVEIITTQNIRASPIPPPRAVLSSPDNDGLIRSKNKGKGEPVSGLKEHNLCENRHVRCKAIPRRSSFEATAKTTKREPKVTNETKSVIEKKTRVGVADTNKRAQERKQKPEWI